MGGHDETLVAGQPPGFFVKVGQPTDTLMCTIKEGELHTLIAALEEEHASWGRVSSSIACGISALGGLAGVGTGAATAAPAAAWWAWATLIVLAVVFFALLVGCLVLVADGLRRWMAARGKGEEMVQGFIRKAEEADRWAVAMSASSMHPGLAPNERPKP